MYHDEFAKKPERDEAAGRNFLPGLAMMIGGGIWLGLMVILNRPILTLLFLLSGLLPLLAPCLSIGWYRFRQFVARPTALTKSQSRSYLSTPHLRMTSRDALNSPYRSAIRKEPIETGVR